MSTGRPTRRSRRALRAAMLLHASGVLALVVLGAAFPLPDAPFARLARSPHVTAADGTPMHVGLTAAGERILPVRLSAISPHVAHAVIAAEDHRFSHHAGVDPRGIVRAAVANLAGGSRRQGASTITMQLARLIDPQPRTWPGKIVQAFRAWQLEQRFSKAELIECYLGHVPLGGNVHGVEAAARWIFGKPAAVLDPAEAALLTSLLPSPTRFLPWRDPEGARARRDRVLASMRAEGYLDDRDLAHALGRDLGVRRTPFPDVAPHAWLRAVDGRTSIEPSFQASVEQIAADAAGVDGLAIVVLDNERSAVCALAGARIPDAGVLDAAGRPRSAGSTLKPFLYALAFDQGLAVPATRLLDLPWRTRDWAPGNFDDAWQGPLPAGEALSTSRNLPAIRLAVALEQGALASVLRRAGLTHVRSSTVSASVDLAVGTDDVTALELAGAYAALARGGSWIRPWLAETDRPTNAPRPVCSRGAAELVTRALADPTRARPAGAPAHGVAWKTGTSSRRRDAWAAGYTSRFTAVVWRGRLDGRPHPSLVGARAAEPLLFAVLQAVDPDPARFAPPTDVAPVRVCRETGRAATEACPTAETVLRPRDARPLVPCDVHHHLDFDVETGRLRCEACVRGHAVETRGVAVWAPVEAAWRRRTGLPVGGLPAHAADCVAPREPVALAPVFLEPRSLQIFDAPSGEASVPVHVLTSDPDEEVSLLVDGRREVTEGRAQRRVVLGPGVHVLTAVTASGRCATVEIRVTR